MKRNKSSHQISLETKIKAVEEEIRKTPYHKGTEHHIGLLRARLAILRQRLLAGTTPKAGGGKDQFMVAKAGQATVLLFGPPSVGKSSLLNRLTAAQSRVGDYSFTTRKVIPGMLIWRGAQIQLLEVPGLLTEGNLDFGGGRQILAAARASDLLLLITDPSRIDEVKKILAKLTMAGIRLNQSPPHLEVQNRHGGGVEVIGPFSLAKRKELGNLAHALGMRGRRIILTEPISPERFVDGLLANRVYLPAILVVNKVDLIDDLERRRVRAEGRQLGFNKICLVSARQGQGLKKLKDTVYRRLDFIHFQVVHDQPPGVKWVVRRGQTLKLLFQRYPAVLTEKTPFLQLAKSRRQLSWNYLPAGGETIILR